MNDDQILAALTRLEAGQVKLEAGHTGLQAGLTGLRSDVTGLRVDLMARMDRLQDTVTEVRDDVAVNMGAVEAARRVNDNTRDDVRGLRDQVTVMWHQLKAVEAKVRNISGEA